MKPSLAAVLLLTACGDGGADAMPSPTGATRYAALCAARNLPETASLSPRHHLRAIGVVEFGATGQGTSQRAELWLGGPSRMRFKASAENGARNLFLVESPGIGWLSPARDEKKWESFHSPEVERETFLRWEVLRFPWGWREIVESAAADAITWSRRAGEGEIVIEVGEDLLPRSASYAGVEVALERWLPADDAAWRVARQWSWSGPSGQRGEKYDELGAQWLMFDDWYRPPAVGGRPDRSYRAIGARDGFGVVRATLWRTDAAPDVPDQSGVQWWLRDGERVAAVLLGPDSPPPAHDSGSAPVAEAFEHWLRWTFVGTSEDAHAAAAEISALARETGMTVLGPPLMSEPELEVNSVTILLPVTPKDS